MNRFVRPTCSRSHFSYVREPCKQTYSEKGRGPANSTRCFRYGLGTSLRSHPAGRRGAVTKNCPLLTTSVRC